jgi:hypothetical protein
MMRKGNKMKIALTMPDLAEKKRKQQQKKLTWEDERTIVLILKCVFAKIFKNLGKMAEK